MWNLTASSSVKFNTSECVFASVPYFLDYKAHRIKRRIFVALIYYYWILLQLHYSQVLHDWLWVTLNFNIISFLCCTTQQSPEDQVHLGMKLDLCSTDIYSHTGGHAVQPVNVEEGRLALPLHLSSWSLPAPPPAPPDLHLDSFSGPLSAYGFQKWQIEQLTRSMCRFWGWWWWHIQTSLKDKGGDYIILIIPQEPEGKIKHIIHLF